MLWLDPPPHLEALVLQGSLRLGAFSVSHKHFWHLDTEARLLFALERVLKLVSAL